ncbi:MAG: DUF309 domain-containing protein [Planctomycetes bacterium]|nr:DUF309 domain-containing protein [Planctomycetota bacterium]
MTDPVARGLALARASRWFEAHEAFEEGWRAEAEPGRRATLRALVHACVALEHRRRGNAIGADLQLAKARARAAEGPAGDPLAEVARRWAAAIAAAGPDAWPTP